MGIIIKQSIRGTLVTYIGAALGAVMVIFLYPLFLTPEIIGLTRVLSEFALFFSFIAMLGMPSLILKFFPFFSQSTRNKNGFFTLVFLTPLVGFAIFSLVILLFKQPFIQYFGKNSELFVHYFYLVFPLALFMIYMSVTESLSAQLQRIVFPKMVREMAVRLLTIALIVAFFYQWVSLPAFLYAFVGIYMAAMLIDLGYFGYIHPFTPTLPDRHLRSKRMTRQMGIFALYVILNGIGSSMVNKIDIFMISSSLGLSETGIYSIAFFIATMIEIPARSINLISLPHISRALKERKMAIVTDFYQKITHNQLLIAGFLLLMIWINIDNIFDIMPKGDTFRAGKYVVLFIGLSKFFDVVTGINVYILTYSRFYYYSLYLILLLGVLTVVFNLIFIPLLGIKGAALATLITLLLFNLLLISVVKLKLHTQPFRPKNLLAMGVLLAAYGINLLLPELKQPIVDALYRSAIIGILYIFVVLRFNLSDEITATYHNLRQHPLAKKWLRF